MPKLSFLPLTEWNSPREALGDYAELQTMTCSTLIFQHSIHSIQEDNKVLLEIKHIRAYTPAVLLSNTTVLINEIILVSSCKVRIISMVLALERAAASSLPYQPRMPLPRAGDKTQFWASSHSHFPALLSPPRLLAKSLAFLIYKKQ